MQNQISKKCEIKSTRKPYKIIGILGNGTFGTVYHAKDSNGIECAIKRTEKRSEIFSREIFILQQLDHENIVKLYDYFFTYDQDQEEKVKINPSYNIVWQNMTMEYVPNNLWDLIQKTQFSIFHIKHYFRQLCLGVDYIHTKNIIHRDLTPSNVLISNSGDVKVTDFGSAKKLGSSDGNTCYICALYYRPPEMILGCPDYTTKCDIWSLGCIFAEMLLGIPLFYGRSNEDQLNRIVQIIGTPKRTDLEAMNCPKENLDVLNLPKLEGVDFHMLFHRKKQEQEDLEEAIDLLEHLIVYHPDKRFSAKQCLMHPFLKTRTT